MPASVRKEKSTTGRIDWLRPAVHAASRMSPALAGEVASRWFFRTSRLELSAAERALLARGTTRKIGFRGSRLVARSFGEGPAVVVLVHGWNGSSGQLAPLAVALARAGREAILFDAPAHGDSPGTETTVPEMARAARVVADAYGGASAVVAHSLGAVAVSLAMAEGWAVERAVMIAPPISPESWMQRFASALGLADGARVELRRAIERRAGLPFERIAPLEHARGASGKLLVIHDAGDREVPFAAGQALSVAWPGAELVRTQGLGHRRILADAEVIEHCVRFLSPPFEAPVSDLARLVG